MLVVCEIKRCYIRMCGCYISVTVIIMFTSKSMWKVKEYILIELYMFKQIIYVYV